MKTVFIQTVRAAIRKLQRQVKETGCGTARQKRLVFQSLNTMGFESSGEGMYATVVVARRVAVKVVRTETSTSAIAYLRWARQNNKTHPLAPKVFGIHQVGNLTLILMERLYERCQEAGKFVNKLTRIHCGYWGGRRGKVNIPYSGKSVRGVMQQVRQIILAGRRKARIDLHDSNVLFRMNGSSSRPVLSDPIAG